MNKQKLIDKAVEYFRGKWVDTRDGFDRLVYTPDRNILFHIWSADWSNNGKWTELCTKDEFVQRARELGWCNGYKWGVKYRTNGEKPDLPNDVEIEWLSADSNWIKTITHGLVWSVKDGGDENISKFRIIDKRYKPVSEITEKQQNVSGFPDNKQNTGNVSADNSWHERGELPPVGSFVDVVGEVRYGSGETNCEVITHVEDCAVIRMSWGLGCFESHVLKPVKSEREKFQEAVLKAIDGTPPDLINTLFDAGFRAPE